MNREIHVRFWESLGCDSPGLLTCRTLSIVLAYFGCGFRMCA
jgi:hypothetical protein